MHVSFRGRTGFLALCLLLLFTKAPAAQGLPALIPYLAGGKWGYADSNGRLVVPVQFAMAQPLKRDRARVRRNGLFGVIDTRGQFIFPPEFDNYTDFSRSDYCWGYKGDSCWILGRDGSRIAIPAHYEKLGIWAEGLSVVVRGGRYGVVDSLGQEVVPPRFDNSGPAFSGGFLSVYMENRWSYVDRAGRLIAEFRYARADDFAHGLGFVCANSRGCGFIDSAETELVPLQRQCGWIIPFAGGYCSCIDKLGRWGYVDRTGRVILPPRFRWIRRFSDGLANAGSADSVFGLDPIGRIVFAKKGWRDLGAFIEGISAVEDSSGRSGYVDTAGRIVIAFRFDNAGDFQEGLARVERRGKTGYIDHKGRDVIPLQYDDGAAYDFENGIAMVERRGEQFFIDRKGREYIKW